MIKTILILDNYDSFTYNLYHLLYQVRPDYKFSLLRNRDKEIYKHSWDGVIVSPGPGTPDETGFLRHFFKSTIEKENIPYFGICLGMQFLGSYYGLSVRKVSPRHGRTSLVSHEKESFFHDIKNPLTTMRYNSLGISAEETELLSSPLKVLATEKDGDLVMALKHIKHPFMGVQFHPESFLSEESFNLMNNFFEEYID
jgi:anthranilate synthase/aminodeoxychorismate synthase-like glutamine amidotransferase